MDAAEFKLNEILRMDVRDQMRLAFEAGPLDALGKYYRDAGCSEVSIGRLLEALDVLRREQADMNGTPINRWLSEASKLPDETYSTLYPDDKPGEAMPYWPTGCTKLDALTDGGGYGMTVISGEPKVGKSLLAISSAIEAARHGWRVVYFNAELTRTAMIHRIVSYAKSVDGLKDHLAIQQVEAGFSVDDALEAVRGQLDFSVDRLLMVFDSINRIVDLSTEDGSELGYWRTLRSWSELPRRTARVSEGRISSLVVSELNKQGRTKGGSLDYAADLVVSIKADAVEGDSDLVYMTVPYARASRCGKVGELVRSWEHGRFK